MTGGGLGDSLLKETVPSPEPAGGGASPKACGHRLHPHLRLVPPWKHSFPPESLQTCSPSTLFWSRGPGCGRISLSSWECRPMQWGPWNLPFLPEVFGFHKVPPLSDEKGQGSVLGSGRSGPASCSSSGSAGTSSLGLIHSAGWWI